MKYIKNLLIALLVIFIIGICPNVFASPQLIGTGNAPAINFSQTITSAYMNFIMPKFPANPSVNSSFNGNFQVAHVDSASGIYSFVYFTAQIGNYGIPATKKYKIEISYQSENSNNLHDGFLTDYAYPGDSIDWTYTDAGALNAVRIVNNGGSGHGSWDHSGTWSWTGIHPDTRAIPMITYTVDPTFGPTFGHNCIGDMPAQDVHNSSTHIMTLNFLAFVTLVDGTRHDMVLVPMSIPNTNVTPTSCNLTLTTGTYGPYITNILTAYSGG